MSLATNEVIINPAMFLVRWWNRFVKGFTLNDVPSTHTPKTLSSYWIITTNYTASRKLRALWASKVFMSTILVFSTLGHIHTCSKKPTKNFDSKKSISVEIYLRYSDHRMELLSHHCAHAQGEQYQSLSPQLSQHRNINTDSRTPQLLPSPDTLRQVRQFMWAQD